MGTDRNKEKSWIKRHWKSVTAAGALGAGLTAYLSYRLSEPPPLVQPMQKGEKPLTFQDVMIPLGNSAGPVSQNKIDAMYADYYNQVKQALEKDKNAVIHVGGGHYNYDSFLVNLMFLDIASRLGIPNVSFETNQDQLDKTLTSIDQAIVQDQRTAKTLEESTPAQLLSNAVKANYKKMPPLLLFNRIDKLRDPTGVPPDNAVVTLYFATTLGMTPRAHDPFYEERQNSNDIALNDKAEKAMIKAIDKIPGSTIIFEGSDHLPPLVKASQEKHTVLAFDGRNADTNRKIIPETDLSRMLDKRLAAANIPTIIIEGKEANAGEALKMVLGASIRHQEQQKEINPQQGNLLRISLQQVASLEAPGRKR